MVEFVVELVLSTLIEILVEPVLSSFKDLASLIPGAVMEAKRRARKPALRPGGAEAERYCTRPTRDRRY